MMKKRYLQTTGQDVRTLYARRMESRLAKAQFALAFGYKDRRAVMNLHPGIGDIGNSLLLLFSFLFASICFA